LREERSEEREEEEGKMLQNIFFPVSRFFILFYFIFSIDKNKG